MNKILLRRACLALTLVFPLALTSCLPHEKSVAPQTGIMLTLALTLEILFLGLSVVGNLKTLLGGKIRVLVAVAGIALLLPIGAVLGTPVAQLGEFWLTYFLSFGLVALLYLVTEELLVEAHKGDRDTPLGTAMFFAGFMILMLIEEGL